MKRYIRLVLLAILAVVITCGCNGKKPQEASVPIDFTIVSEEDIPDALFSIIEEKKTGDMSLTYTTRNDIYIVRGYGMRPTNGYSIQVQELGQTSDRIVFKALLTGPKEGDNTTGIPSYPYIVVKIKAIDLPVDFQ